MSEETCPDCGRLFATTAHEQTRETWCNGTDTHGCLRHQAARERAGNNQTNLLLTLEKSYTSTLEEKLSVATARLENVLDSSKEGAWLARALDAERELSAATARASELEDLFQRTHGCHWSWVHKVTELGERVARAEAQLRPFQLLWEHAAKDDGNGPTLQLHHEGEGFDKPASVYFEHSPDEQVGTGLTWPEAAADLCEKLGLLQPEP